MRRSPGTAGPPDSYYDAVSAGSRWFSGGIVFVILTLFSSLIAELSAWAWFLVGLLTLVALLCFSRFVYYGMSSGRLWRQWHESAGGLRGTGYRGWLRDFAVGHPIATGNFILVMMITLMVIVAIAGRRLQ